MVRCPTRFELTELARGRADEARAGALLAHLEECAECGALYDSATGGDGLEDELRRAAGPRDDPAGSVEAGGPGRGGDLVAAGGSLGRYRILRRLGAGGMGIVYEAEQSRPRRRVALKVLQPTAATPGGLRRFELEGEVLSRLAHPAIAHVYEVGSVASPYGALPFLAMELVPGLQPLEHARRHGLDARARVELFLGVCAGVEHAHARGVLHRDLKPSNVLVTEEGAPKVLDFGVARLLDRRPDATATGTGQVIGTLAYTSPEQLAAGEDAVDVRSDVYSLGVVLYELLAGAQPHDLAGRPLAEVVRLLTDARSPAPDVRRRGHGPTARTRGIDRDLAAVVGKSLEKDPRERYRSVDALSDDLRRWLAHEPVGARPCAWPRRAAKAIRRHRRAAAGLAAAGALVVFGAAGTVSQHVRARAAERAALEEARAAAATGAFLDELLASGDPFESLANPDRSVRALLDEASRRLAERAELPGETRAKLLGTLGNAYRRLGDLERAGEHLEQRLALLAAGRPPEAVEFVDAELDLVRLDSDRRRHGSALRRLEELAPRVGPASRLRFAETRGRTLLRSFRFDEARVALEEALRLLAASPDPAPAERAGLQHLLAELEAYRGDHQRALRLQREVLETLAATLGAEHPSTAIARHGLALHLAACGRLEEADAELARALRAFDAVLGEDHPRASYAASDRADLRSALGDREGAIELYRRALEALPDTDPEIHLHLRARVCVRLALLLEESGEAEELLAEASRLMGVDTSGEFDSDHPQVRLARALASEGRHAEVEELYRDLVRRLGPDEARTERALSLYNNLAVALVRQDELEEAEAIFRDSLDVRRELLGDDHYRTATAATNLACVLLLRGEHSEAEALLRDALATCAAELGPAHARTARVRRHLAEAHLAAGHLDEALDASATALSDCVAEHADPEHPHVGDTYLLRGEILLAAGDHPAARDALLRARAILESQRLPDPRLLARASAALAACAAPGAR